MLILALLKEQPSYGYELVERLRSLGLSGLATGAVYPVLSRFERDGWLSSYLQKSDAEHGPEILRTHGQWRNSPRGCRASMERYCRSGSARFVSCYW
ncbi:PadR family transcriptional regulator [Arthrobacter psychrolactophilus]